MRRIYILPNLFTAAALLAGLLAIFEVLHPGGGDLFWACQLVLVAAMFDMIDGLIARLTRTESSFGLQFDSLADVVSFGVAPALLLYSAIHPTFPLLAKATCALYVICAALRLARFNVQAGREERRAFLGLPSPAAAGVAVSLFWALAARGESAAFIIPERLLPPILVVLAYLMVSKFPYLGLKSLPLSKRQPFEILVSIVVVLSLLIALKQHIDLLLLTGFGLYAASGPALWLRRMARRGAGTAIEERGAGSEATRSSAETARSPLGRGRPSR